MHNPFEENIRKMQEEQAALNDASSRGSFVMSHRSSVKSIVSSSHHGHTKSQISGANTNSSLNKQDS